MSEIRRVFINIGKITAEFGAIGVIGFVTNIIKLEKLGQDPSKSTTEFIYDSWNKNKKRLDKNF